MKMTISDIAKLANVSTSAVSIVLNNRTGVSDKTRAKILEIIKKYNYTPNNIAQALVAKETKSIGLIIKEIDNPYFAKVMKGVYDACSELGYSVLLGSSELSLEKESEIINTFLNKRVDGLIISPLQSERANFSYLANILNANYALVILGMIQNYLTNTVDIDNQKAAYDAVSYLIKLGHKKIAHLAGPMHSGHGQKRLEGYKQAHIDSYLPLNNFYIIPIEPYTTNGYQAAINLFSANNDRPTAIFCYNDLIAIGVIEALTKLNIKVPEEVSVVGFDNIDFSGFVRIPLTTVQMPAYEIGKAATKLLIKQITNSTVHLNENIVLEHSLIIRESCARLEVN